MLKNLNSILFLIIFSFAQTVFPVLAQTKIAAPDLWDATAPLPSQAFDKLRPCRMPWPSLGSSDINEKFLHEATYGVTILLEGLCLDATTNTVGARHVYDRSKKEFISSIDSLNQQLEIRRLRLQNREQMYASLGAAVEKLLGGTSKSASRQMNKEIFRQVFKIATDSEIADIQKDLKNPAFSSPPGFTNTMRIPVIPVAGFLKLITKIQMPDGRHCTGSFVGPKIVLINLHCVKPAR